MRPRDRKRCSTGATGKRTATGAGTGRSGGTGAATIGAAAPTTLKTGSLWGSSQTLMLLVVMLTCGLVFAPAYVWSRTSDKDAA